MVKLKSILKPFTPVSDAATSIPPSPSTISELSEASNDSTAKVKKIKQEQYESLYGGSGFMACLKAYKENPRSAPYLGTPAMMLSRTLKFEALEPPFTFRGVETTYDDWLASTVRICDLFKACFSELSRLHSPRVAKQEIADLFKDALYALDRKDFLPLCAAMNKLLLIVAQGNSSDAFGRKLEQGLMTWRLNTYSPAPPVHIKPSFSVHRPLRKAVDPETILMAEQLKTLEAEKAALAEQVEKLRRDKSTLNHALEQQEAVHMEWVEDNYLLTRHIEDNNEQLEGLRRDKSALGHVVEQQTIIANENKQLRHKLRQVVKENRATTAEWAESQNALLDTLSKATAKTTVSPVTLTVAPTVIDPEPLVVTEPVAPVVKPGLSDFATLYQSGTHGTSIIGFNAETGDLVIDKARLQALLADVYGVDSTDYKELSHYSTVVPKNNVAAFLSAFNFPYTGRMRQAGPVGFKPMVAFNAAFREWQETHAAQINAYTARNDKPVEATIAAPGVNTVAAAKVPYIMRDLYSLFVDKLPPYDLMDMDDKIAKKANKPVEYTLHIKLGAKIDDTMNDEALQYVTLDMVKKPLTDTIFGIITKQELGITTPGPLTWEQVEAHKSPLFELTTARKHTAIISRPKDAAIHQRLIRFEAGELVIDHERITAILNNLGLKPTQLAEFHQKWLKLAQTFAENRDVARYLNDFTSKLSALIADKFQSQDLIHFMIRLRSYLTEWKAQYSGPIAASLQRHQAPVAENRIVAPPKVMMRRHSCSNLIDAGQRALGERAMIKPSDFSATPFLYQEKTQLHQQGFGAVSTKMPGIMHFNEQGDFVVDTLRLKKMVEGFHLSVVDQRIFEVNLNALKSRLDQDHNVAAYLTDFNVALQTLVEKNDPAAAKSINSQWQGAYRKWSVQHQAQLAACIEHQQTPVVHSEQGESSVANKNNPPHVNMPDGVAPQLPHTEMKHVH